MVASAMRCCTTALQQARVPRPCASTSLAQRCGPFAPFRASTCPPRGRLEAWRPAAGPAGPPASPSPASPEPSARLVDAMRQSQRRSTDLLALLLDSRDPAATARENLGALSEEFFMTAGTFLTLARKEGNADVATRLERALMAAWDVKQSSLRPELQLLNRLVRAGGEPERRQIYLEGGPSLPPLLSSDGRWFFRTLERLTGDVERQPPNPDKVPLLSKLKAIAREAEAIEKQATKKGFGNGNGNGNGKKA